LKKSLVIAGAVAAALVLGGCGKTTPITSGTATPAPPYVPNVSAEYAIPTSGSAPAGITKTSTAIWFVERTGDKLGMLSETATFTEYPLITPAAQPISVVLGQDGNLWITEFAAGKIAEFNLSTLNFDECTLPTTYGIPTPWGIAAGEDGNLWVTDPGTNGIWSVAPGCGTDTFFPLKTASAGPESIAVGPNGALWFLETNANQVGEILTTATAGSNPVEFPVTTANAGLGTIVSGSDNALWFTETTAAKLGRMLTTGQMTAETPLTGMTAPYGLVNAPNGYFYITDTSKSVVGQYVPSTSAVTTYPTKTANAYPYMMTIGPDNEVYFTEKTANNIGQFRYF
jgi:virginiamycin B lyase